MRYKIVCSNKDGSFTIGEDELDKAIKAKETNQPAAFREGIVLNWNMYVGIVVDHERNGAINEWARTGSKFPETSPFAKLLSDKFTKLPEKVRSKVNEEISIEERKLK